MSEEARAILHEVADRQGWTTETALIVACRYIESQENNPAFEEYLRRLAEQENLADAEAGEA